MYNKLEGLKGKLKGKTAVIRIDANVPVVNGVITDDTRLKEALPSIKFLLEEGVLKLFILSHFGRPKGKVVAEFSLMQILSHLQTLIGENIGFESGSERIILKENLRFNEGEENGSEELAKTLANLGEVYVNDAFSCSHRAHASISVVAKFTKVYAGFLMVKEIESIEKILGAKAGKSLAVVGGSKVSTKITLLKNLISKVDYIFVAGGMANTFLAAQGFNVGASLYEDEFRQTALEILTEAEGVGCKILLPQDVIVCKKLEAYAPCKTALIHEVKEGEMIVDAGTLTVLNLVEVLKGCQMFLWNGPLGVFEVTPFNVSTFLLAREVAGLTTGGGLTSVVGGGDSAAAVMQSGFKNGFSYISTAGGAFLEWLEGKSLPGVECLKK